MEIEARESIEFSVTLTAHDLRHMQQDPIGSVEYILSNARKLLELPPPKKNSSTKALRQVDERQREPCPYPKCGLMMMPRGFGMHFSKSHPISYKEFLARETRKKGNSSRFTLLLPETTGTNHK